MQRREPLTRVRLLLWRRRRHRELAGLRVRHDTRRTMVHRRRHWVPVGSLMQVRRIRLQLLHRWMNRGRLLLLLGQRIQVGDRVVELSLCHTAWQTG